MDKYILQEVMNELSQSETPNDAFNAWLLLGKDSKYFNAIISLSDFNNSAYPMNMIDLLDNRTSGFVPYFSSDKLYFFDYELLNDMFKNTTTGVAFNIDYSVMFDTNFTSYIHRFLSTNLESPLNNRVYSTIDILLRNDYHFDYNFYLIENYEKAFLTGNGMTKTQEILYQNLVSMELFKSIDQVTYCNTGKIKYTITKNEAMLIVDNLIWKLHNSKKHKEFYSAFADMHHYMVLFIIGMLKIQYSQKTTPQKKLKKLFEYTNNVTGAYLDREMVIAYEYFTNPRNVPIFNKINKKMKKGIILDRIENIAWDFIIPRVMEYFIKQGGIGRYFIPFFLSYDVNFIKLIKLYDVKGVLYNTKHDIFQPITDRNNSGYSQQANYIIDFKEYFSDENIEKRKLIANTVKENKFKIIEQEFDKLALIMELR